MTEEEQWDKIFGQYRLTLNGIMNPLRKYGQGIYVDEAIAELVNLSIQLHHRLSGVEEPFYVNKDKLHG